MYVCSYQFLHVDLLASALVFSICTCICICLHVCPHLCIYVRMYVFTFICLHISISLSLSLSLGVPSTRVQAGALLSHPLVGALTRICIHIYPLAFALTFPHRSHFLASHPAPSLHHYLPHAVLLSEHLPAFLACTQDPCWLLTESYLCGTMSPAPYMPPSSHPRFGVAFSTRILCMRALQGAPCPDATGNDAIAGAVKPVSKNQPL